MEPGIGKDIALMLIAVALGLAPWFLDKAGVAIPRLWIAIGGWAAIGCFSWGAAKIGWLVEPQRWHFVTLSVSGIGILCIAVSTSTMWGLLMYGGTKSVAPERPTDKIADPVAAKPESPAPSALTLEPPRIELSLDLSDISTVGLIVRSVGGSDVHNLRIADFVASGHTISFSKAITVLEVGDWTTPLIPKINDFGEALQGSLAMAMMDGWKPQGRVGNYPFTLRYPATAIYCDKAQTYYRASWDYVFYPSRYKKWISSDEMVREIAKKLEGPFLTLSPIEIEKISEWAHS